MKYGIGLDCGITSVGFSVMELDEHDEPYRIIKLGSRIFTQAENPKDGASLALPRREARGTRRRLRRHHHRLERIKYMLVNENILTEKELETLFLGQLSDIYMLRTKALDEPLTNTEFSRVLINLAQRRGFKSNRKNDKEGDAGKLLTAVNENALLMQEHGYRTVGEMYYKDEKYSQYKRNKGEAYSNTVSRSMIEDEIHSVFVSQRKFGNQFASEDIENKYVAIAMSQRPFDLGPGEGNANSPSPYAGNQIEKMIGKCTFFPEEKRTAKATYSFQVFTLWQNINNIRIVSSNGEYRNLSDFERKQIFDLCHKSPSVKYTKIRQVLNLPEGERFKNLSYGRKEVEEVEKTSFDYMKYYHQMRKALDNIKKDFINCVSIADRNEIGYAFTAYKTDSQIRTYLQEKEIDEQVIDTLIDHLTSFSKFGHISVKACDKIIPFLEKGERYDKACLEAGLDFRAHNGTKKNMLLPATSYQLEDVNNPVVRRAVSQTIKVINAIIREQGSSPTYVNIELARELSKNFDERKKIQKSMEENASKNEKIKKRLQEDFHIPNPTGLDIVTLKLWDEQDGRCPYTQKAIDATRLFRDVGYVDIDHIVPYSISFNDGYNNKVLTFSKENRQKGNKLPLEYLNGKDADNFRVWVNANIKNYAKKQNLLKEKITAQDLEGFKERNLTDTKYLSKLLYNYINDNLAFEDWNNGNKRHVTTVNGAATAYMRKRWGISKIREDGDLHHAVDATVIACFTQGMIQKITKYSKYREIEFSDTDEGSFVVDRHGEIIDKFPFPYPTFRRELEIRLTNDPQHWLTEVRLPNYTKDDISAVKPCFVSRMPNRKVTGPSNKDTIRASRDEGYTISKVELSSLKLKDGEIQNYYNPGSDKLLYNALKARLEQFDGDGAKAFPKDYVFRKPTSTGEQGPIVKKVKIREKSTLNVNVRSGNGVAENGSMVRIDVFKVEGEGYYFVPIYVSDTIKPELPNKASVQGKPYSEWKEMKEEDFIFSLYPNDLIHIRSAKGIKLNVSNKDSSLPKNKTVNEDFFYYIKAGISVAQITVKNNDASYEQPSLGIKSLDSIEKYVVDPIGNYTKVGKEKRMRFR